MPVTDVGAASASGGDYIDAYLVQIGVDAEAAAQQVEQFADFAQERLSQIDLAFDKRTDLGVESVQKLWERFDNLAERVQKRFSEVSFGDIQDVESVRGVTERIERNRQEARAGLADVKRQAAEGTEAIGGLRQMGALAFGLWIGLANQLVTSLFSAVGAVQEFVTSFVAGGVQINATMERLLLNLNQMTTSEESSRAIIEHLRREWAAFGVSVADAASAASTLIPFAEGDIDKLDQMTELVTRLSMLTGDVGQSTMILTQAMAGNTFRIARLLGIGTEQANELSRELREGTITTEEFLGFISLAADRMGATTEAAKEFGDTFEGQINRIMTEIQGLQAILGAPLFGELKEAMTEIITLLTGETENFREAALRIGATLAAVFQIAVEAVKNIIVGMQALPGVVANVEKIFDALRDRVFEEIFASISNLTISFLQFINISLEGLNVLIGVVNQLNAGIEEIGVGLGIIKEGALEIQEVELLKFDPEEIREHAREMGRAVSDTLGEVGDALSLGGLLGEMADFFGVDIELFPNFAERVQAFEDEWAHLLDVNEEGGRELAEQVDVFADEGLDEWIEYLRDLRDEFERFDEQMTDEHQRHNDELVDIETNAQEDREAAWKRFYDALEDVNDDYDQRVEDAGRDLNRDLARIDRRFADDEQDIQRDRIQRVEEIEEDHVEEMRRIRDRLRLQLFDAINERDARRVFELLMETRQDRQEAERDRQRAVNDISQETQDRLQELERRREQERRERLISYRQELDDLRRQRDRRRNELIEEREERLQIIEQTRVAEIEREMLHHQEQLLMIQANLEERLALVARGWRERGELEKAGLEAIMDLAIGVFGPNGAYLNLVDGFNDALMDAVNQANQIATQFQQQTNQIAQSASNVAGGINQPGLPQSGLLQEVFMGQHGLDMTVNQPTAFIAGEPSGNEERVIIIPKGKPGRVDHGRQSLGEGGPDEMDINILVTARGLSEEFEADLAVQVAEIVGGRVNGPRRTRRR